MPASIKPQQGVFFFPLKLQACGLNNKVQLAHLLVLYQVVDQESFY